MNDKNAKMLKKRMANFEKDEILAKMVPQKMKWTKRFKFWPFHLYREPLIGLTSGFDDLFGTSEKEEKKDPVPFGEYRVSWGEHRRKMRKLCPFQYWLREEARYIVYIPWRQLKDKWYNFKCWLRPFNVLKIHTLPRTWVDEDRLLVHAIFAVLERYMSEKPEDIVDFKHNKEQKAFWKDISQAWAWWQKREKREKELEKAHSTAYKRSRKLKYEQKYGDVNALEKKYEQEETEMLQLILKHRHGLWV